MRTWVFQTLKLSGIWTPLGNRLYETSRMTRVPDKKPYGFYRMGLAAPMLHTEAPVISTPFQLFIHDEPGDFMRIDSLLALAKDSLTLWPPLHHDARFIKCEWLGCSEDIEEDPLTGTISKYARYRLVHLP